MSLAKSVVRDVLDEAKRRDQLVLTGEKVAPHRDPTRTALNGLYPAHPLIVCDNVAIAKALCANTNRLFEQDPVTYPRHEGWHAEVVHTDALDVATGKRVPGKPLTPQHPWMRSKAIGYRMDASCSRVLFVVGIGREGVNNPACGPVGIATPQGSIVEIIQRALGRQLRSIISLRDGRFLAPPAPLDTVLIITHKSFRNAMSIERAIDFVCNMEEYLEGLPRIEALDDADPTDPEKLQQRVSLQTKEKIDIAARLGQADENGEPFTIDDVVTEFAGLDTGPRVDKIRDWATKVRDEPESARQEVHLDGPIRPNLIVTRETIRHDPTDADLERHLKIHHPDRVHRYVPIDDAHRELIELLFAQHASLFHLPPLTSDDHLEQIRRDIAGQVKRHLGPHAASDRKKDFGNHAHALVGSAVLMKLGVPEGQGARNDSDWDTPQVHALLRRPDVQGEIIGWVTGRLIDEGYCPALRALRTQILGNQ